MKTIKLAGILCLILTIQAVTAQQQEEYYFSKILKGSFEEITNKTIFVLKQQGFGLITEIDMDVKLKEKFDKPAAEVTKKFKAALKEL